MISVHILHIYIYIYIVFSGKKMKHTPWKFLFYKTKVYHQKKKNTIHAYV